MKIVSLEIAAEDVETLQKVLRCPSSEGREILRAKIILGFADNKSCVRQKRTEGSNPSLSAENPVS